MRKNTPILKLSPGHWIQENWRPRCNHFIRTLWLIDLLLLIPIPILKTPQNKKLALFSSLGSAPLIQNPSPQKRGGEKEKKEEEKLLSASASPWTSRRRESWQRPAMGSFRPPIPSSICGCSSILFEKTSSSTS